MKQKHKKQNILTIKTIKKNNLALSENGQPINQIQQKQNILTIKIKKNIMETKFYKWSVSFSDGVDQVVMISSGISCRVNNFGINQKIEYYDYELNVNDMIPATKEEFIIVYNKVNGEILSRILNTIL